MTAPLPSVRARAFISEGTFTTLGKHASRQARNPYFIEVAQKKGLGQLQ